MQVTILDKEDVSNIKPGRYLVSSDDPRYFSLISMPNSKILDSRSAEDGRHTLAIVEIGANKMRQVSNPPETKAMGMDPSFFSSAKREYVTWQDKWIATQRYIRGTQGVLTWNGSPQLIII